jgi:PHD/YefM family antitoxin component YafN of YafNO toxin-antitoxin module
VLVSTDKAARRSVDSPAGLADAVERAARSKERVVVLREGQEIAAVVPVEDLARLEDADRAEDARRDARVRGLDALRRLQADAVARGLDKMTSEEIDAEIKAARDERRRRVPEPPSR